MDHITSDVINNDRLTRIGVHVTRGWVTGGLIDCLELLAGRDSLINSLLRPTARPHLFQNFGADLRRNLSDRLD